MKHCLLIMSLFVGSLGTGFAQQDTTKTKRTAPGREYKGFELGEVTTPEGRKIRIYLPTETEGFGKVLSFYDQSPETRPRPKVKMISTDKVQSMLIGGIYSERMSVEGKSHTVLATRLVEGPVELFNYVDDEQKSALGPNGIITQGTPLLPRKIWFVRRAGGPLLQIKHFKFREQMTEFVKDCPELAQKIEHFTDSYQYRNMPTIIEEYNQFLTNKASK